MTIDTSRMELPHLHVLRRHTCAERHAHAITGIDVGISGGGIDPARTARREDRRLQTQGNTL